MKRTLLRTTTGKILNWFKLYPSDEHLQFLEQKRSSSLLQRKVHRWCPSPALAPSKQICSNTTLKACCSIYQHLCHAIGTKGTVPRIVLVIHPSLRQLQLLHSPSWRWIYFFLFLSRLTNWLAGCWLGTYNSKNMTFCWPDPAVRWVWQEVTRSRRAEKLCTSTSIIRKRALWSQCCA